MRSGSSLKKNENKKNPKTTRPVPISVDTGTKRTCYAFLIKSEDNLGGGGGNDLPPIKEVFAP